MSGARELRDQLVDGLVMSGRIHNPRLAAAFGAVPREVFVPNVELSQAYRDEAIVTRWDGEGRPLSSSSQPAMMATMLEQLGVEPGHRVLEIGTGTGYNAALLARLVGATGHVVSVDIDEDVTRQARDHLDQAGCPKVEVVHADGADGWPPGAPYDRIILTASTRDLAPAWLAQLAAAGRLVLPLSLRGMQRSVALEWAGDHLSSVSIEDCGFMPLRGSLAGSDASRPLGSHGTFVVMDGDRPVDAAALQAALAQPGAPVTAEVGVTDAEIMGGLGLWLVLHEPDAALLTAVGAAAEANLVPSSMKFPGMTLALAVLGDHSLAAVVRPGRATTTADGLILAVQPFGPDAGGLANRLLAHVHAWAAHGRMATADLSIHAYPRPATGFATAAAAVIDLPHTRLALEFRKRTG